MKRNNQIKENQLRLLLLAFIVVFSNGAVAQVTKQKAKQKPNI